MGKKYVVFWGITSPRRARSNTSSMRVARSRKAPAYSPESNGMAESFVKTFKRDYVYLNKLETAAAVLDQLGTWFDDYNEVHPHSGLQMRSPREYLRAAR